MSLYSEYYLAHYGVKGMKWGVRKARRVAQKDAKEYARAKMYYGEGAGNRRKLIRAKVEERSKDENYKKAFDEALAQQDMADHATKAKAERTANTAVKTTVKTGRGIVNSALGRIGSASAAAATIYTVGQVTGINQKVSDLMKKKVSELTGR